MLAYLVLANRNAAPIDESIVRRFDRDDLTELPFVPEERVVWKNRDGSCVFIGWQAFTDLAGIGSHWAIDERGLTAFGGHCWPRVTGWQHGTGTSWAAQLRAFLDGRHGVDVREELYGQFTLVALETTGEGLITPDFATIDPVFLAERGELVAISNRSGLCARAVAPPGATPERSLTGAGWVICHTEMFFDGETGYWDVERLPLGAHLFLDGRRGFTTIEPVRCPLGPMGETATYGELLDKVERDLRQTIRAIAALPGPHPQILLSGGIDSRLLTALIVSEGLRDRFRFVTFGPPERSDPIVAGRIAQEYQLDWSLIDPSGRTVDEEREEIRAHAGLAEGLMNGWNAVGPVEYSGTITVTGLAGEHLRWGRTSRAGMSVTTEDELLALLRRNITFDPLRVMRPGVLEYYHQTVAEWAREMLRRGETLQQVASYFNQTGQSRHRFAVVQAWGERMTLTPYITPVIVRANQQLPPEQRPDPRFQIDLMRRFDLPLSLLPFAAQGWSETAFAHLPDADRYRAIAPVLSDAVDGRTWRVVRYRDYLPMLESYLLDGDNPIHELIDSKRLALVLPAGDAHDGRTRRIWALLTAAIWMGRHESGARIARKAG